MSELESQVDEVVQDEQTEVVDEVEQEVEQTEAAELAPASDVEHEEQPQAVQGTDENKVNQDKINAAINKQYRLRKEAEEKAAEYERQIQQFQQRSPQETQDLPPLPDPFSDTYEQDIAKYSEAQQKAGARAEQQRIQQQMYQQQQQQIQAQREAELQKDAESFLGRGSEFGIEKQDLINYSSQAAQYVDAQLANEIVKDSEGPLLAKYLAQNPLEAANIQGMTPYQQAIYIEREVRPKAHALKPKSTAAPKPPTKVDGKANVDNSGLKYARGSFE